MSETVLNYDLAVIGGGPAGMAAALKAKECGVSKIVILFEIKINSEIIRFFR